MTGPVRCRPRVEPQIRAWLVTADNVEEIAKWARAGYWPRSSGQPLVWLRVDEYDPIVKVAPGEYVLQGVTGQFFRVTAAEFHDKYEVIPR